MAIKFLNTVAVDDNVLFVDATNDRVGIGTTSPTEKLEVSEGFILSSGASTNHGFELSRDSADTYQIRHLDGGLTIFNSTDSRKEMTFRGDGNVGIGTTSPDATLSVVGETSTNNLIGGSINLATSYGWTIPSGTFTQRVGYYGGDFTLNGVSAENGMQRGLGPFNDRQLLWTTTGSTDNNADGGWNKTLTNLDIDSSYLSVVYFKRVSSNTSGTFYHGTGNNILNLNGTANVNPYFSVQALSGLDQNVWYVSIGVIQSNSDSNTTAYTDISGLYRLDTGAKIANANAYKFDSNGATLSRGHRAYLYYSTDVDVVAQFANPGFYKIDGDQPKLQDIIGGGTDDAFWSANGDDIYNDNSGNVGIGTGSPSTKLDVNGTVVSQGGTYIAANGTVTDAAYVVKQNDKIYSEIGDGYLRNLIYHASNGSIQIGQDGTGLITDIIMKPGTSGNVIFRTSSNSETARINSSGNVGIATTSPAAKLDIISPGLSTMFRLSSTEANATTKYGAILGRHYTNAEENVTGMLITSNSSSTGGTVSIGGGISSANAVNNVIFYTAANNTTLTGTERMRITNAGNVGIGNTSPSFPLDVTGVINVDNSGTGAPIILNSSSTNSGGNFLHAKKSDGSNQWVFGANNGSDDRVTIRQYNPASIVFQNNVAEAMVINSSANVGIGTTAPGSKLDVVGATNTSDSSLLRVRTTDNPNAPEKVVGFYVNTNTERGFISVNQYATTYSTSSDYRLKENIVPISNGIERLKELNPCRFNFIGADHALDGFLAHEAAEVVPEAVTGDKDAVDKDNNPLYQGIDQSKVVPLLTAALQEAIEKIEQLETRIQTLENN